MYLRDLLAAGTTHMEAESEDMERVLSAVEAVIEVQGRLARCPHGAGVRHEP